MTRHLNIAAGCFAPNWLPSLDDLRESVFDQVRDARGELVVFPEYAAMAPALVGQPDGDPAPLVWAERGAAAHADWVEICRAAAQRFGCFILAGSGPVRRAEGHGAPYVNRAVFCAPDGSTACQDKMIPTPWERSDMHMAGGEGLTLFDTPLGKIGVTICYDAEFPIFARALAAAGADLILVPSCTETQAGQDRVQIASRARALENQCLVVQAPMNGAVAGCDPIGVTVGQAGMFGPPDYGQPAGGIHALSDPQSGPWLRLDVDPSEIVAARTRGDVKLFSDWAAQGVPDQPVKIIPLGK